MSGLSDTTCGIATGKVAAGGAIVRHEQGVADENRITNHMVHAGRRVAGCMDGSGVDAADLVGFAVFEKVVELAAITGEIGSCIEYRCEGVLHRADVFANG